MLTQRGVTLVFACFVASGALALNVRDFGAKGDGKSDDTEAIRKAVVEAHRLGEPLKVRSGWVTDGPIPEVVFPKGTYCVSDTIGVLRDSVLRGESGATIRQIKSSKDIFYFSSAFRCRVSGLAFESGRVSLRFATHNNDTANLVVRDCSFRNAGAAAVECLSFSQVVAGKKRSVAPYLVHEGVVSPNPAYDEPRQGYYNSTLLTIDGCSFENCWRAADFRCDAAIVSNCRVVSSEEGEGGAFLVSSRVHFYGLDITLRRGRNPRLCAFEVYGRGSIVDIESSAVRTDDGLGACTVRSSVLPGYIAGYLALNDLTVESGASSDAAPVVIEKDSVPCMLSIAGLVEKGVRHDDPVCASDGLTDEVKAKSRHFKGIPVERTYSCVVSEASRPRPVRPVAPIRSSGMMLKAVDFGVDLNPDTDDTMALRRAFAAASDAGATVMLPATWINLSETVDVPDGIAVVGEGVAGVRMTGGAQTAFRAMDFTNLTFENLHFHLGTHAMQVCAQRRGLLSKLIKRKACLQIRECHFSDLASYAIEATAGDVGERGSGRRDGSGDLDIILDGGVAFTQKLYRGNGNLWWDRSWLEVLGESKEGTNLSSVACVNYGKMVVRDMVGIPVALHAITARLEKDKTLPRRVGDYRWIDNYGECISLFTRYGGEYGGLTPVYNYGSAQTHIEGGYAWFESGLTRRHPIVADRPDAELSLFCVPCSPNLGREPVTFVWRNEKGGLAPTMRQKLSCYFPLNR